MSHNQKLKIPSSRVPRPAPSPPRWPEAPHAPIVAFLNGEVLINKGHLAEGVVKVARHEAQQRPHDVHVPDVHRLRVQPSEQISSHSITRSMTLAAALCSKRTELQQAHSAPGKPPTLRLLSQRPFAVASTPVCSWQTRPATSQAFVQSTTLIEAGHGAADSAPSAVCSLVNVVYRICRRTSTQHPSCSFVGPAACMPVITSSSKPGSSPGPKCAQEPSRPSRSRCSGPSWPPPAQLAAFPRPASRPPLQRRPAWPAQRQELSSRSTVRLRPAEHIKSLSCKVQKISIVTCRGGAGAAPARLQLLLRPLHPS